MRSEVRNSRQRSPIRAFTSNRTKLNQVSNVGSGSKIIVACSPLKVGSWKIARLPWCVFFPGELRASFAVRAPVLDPVNTGSGPREPDEPQLSKSSCISTGRSRSASPVRSAHPIPTGRKQQQRDGPSGHTGIL